MKLRTLIATLLIFAITACQSAEFIEGEGLVVLEGATLISGRKIIEDSAIVIGGDRIYRVGAKGDYLYPEDATLIDTNGSWVIPGYVDTHVHYTEQNQDVQDEILRTLLANGVTTVRAAAGFAQSNVAMREAIEAGERLGPRMRTAGFPIDTPDGPQSWMVQVSNEEEMRAAVREQADIGVDYIKLYRTIGPDLAAIAIDEAHALGLKVIGHLNLTTFAQASALGIDGIVHTGIYAPTWELAPREHWDAIRTAFNAWRRPGTEGGFNLLRENVKLDSPESMAWFVALAEAQTPLEPNLVMLAAIAFGDDEAMYQSFEPENAPETWKGSRRLAFPMGEEVDKSWRREARATYPLFEEIAVRLYRAGAILSVGTDLANPWMTPGTSYHRELELLNDAGLTPNEIFLMATRNGAVAMGLETEVGAIEPGFSADLVVLHANPLDEIANFRSIHEVWVRGKRYTPEELNQYTVD